MSHSVKFTSPKSVVVVGAARTPIGSFNGSLSKVPAHSLGATAIKAAIKQAQISEHEVDEVILGQVLTAGCGQNPARQAAFEAGLPKETTAYLVNQLCGSGLRAIILGVQQILTGQSSIVVAGGQESMSMSRHATHLRNGIKINNIDLQDTMVTDGLTDAFHSYHMGVTAENIARVMLISREEQDKFATNSQNKAESAQASGKFVDEIAPVIVQTRKGDQVIESDEFIRPGTTIESLARLKPAFAQEGSVTAGNSSGLNDGAAAVILMSEDEAQKRGLKSLLRIVSWAVTGIDPSVMGLGPISATKKALQNAGWDINELNLVEANEAFAAQAYAVVSSLELDPKIVNVNGGAIALGHPIGASGARIFVTLLYEMNRRGARRGIATLCVGGGMGLAVCVELS
ncbi:acetyl-CoA C-acetyltransferase [Xenorhabdus innexi]|uniref:Acetyl-CoA acetyltransferase n=1 Tax=Xenorhabdus innexi TaxID=290109 RepID=A0A1N6MTC8_9GAMM|nr:acetyl-CoA C-acetyltransferase [Xenorhabdus innexi]PHM29444.1 acetyl-CoA acetyltransferase [Xenorhabdus innexi]SIP72044.1 Acetyl-CoA acetyltransferase [Xenorhabdus innexi]